MLTVAVGTAFGHLVGWKTVLAGVAFLAIAAMAVVVGVRGKARRRNRGRGDAAPARGTYRAKPLLSGWERDAFPTLLAQIPHGMHLCPQVRLADMLDAGNGGRWTGALAGVASKSVDFAVIDAQGRVALVVELNDKTHEQPDRRRRDAFVKAALTQAGIPLASFRPGRPLDLSRWLGR